MKKKILKIAEKEFAILIESYDKFINIFVDDWRGYRFVFDTEDVGNCRNDCSNCDLYKLLKDKPENQLFSCGLKLATAEDKKLFGPQNFLNCKTYQQYQNCYVNFVQKNKLTPKEFREELGLIRNLALLYAKENDGKDLCKSFKDETTELIRNAMKRKLNKRGT